MKPRLKLNSKALVGHTGPITYIATCVVTRTEHSASEVEKSTTRVATASEDGTVIIWDGDFGRILSKILSPKELCTALEWSSGGETLYASFNSEVHVYCMKDLPAEVPYKEALHIYKYNMDEIGQLSLDENDRYLAAADDSGEVQIIDCQTNKRQHKLTRGHTNICSGVAFINGRPWECVSGGLDGKLILWDWNRGVPKHVVDFMDLSQATGATPMVNPPMINNVQVCKDGRRCVVGLADCTVRVFDIVTIRSGGDNNVGKGKKQGGGKGGGGSRQQNRKPPRREMRQIRCLRGVHKNSVSAIAVLKDTVVSSRGSSVGNVESNNDKTDRMCVVSAGADRKICVWDVDCRAQTVSDAPEIPYDGLISEGLLCSITHPHVINWISTVRFDNNENSLFIAVADQRHTVTFYELCL
eukprot:CFRG2488T1